MPLVAAAAGAGRLMPGLGRRGAADLVGLERFVGEPDPKRPPAGRLRHRVTFEELVVGLDSDGAQVELETATDGNSNGTVTSTLDIVVTPVVDIANDTIATHAGTPVVVPVLGNDGFENPGAAVTVVTAGAHGTVVINANGTVTYTPVALRRRPRSVEA